jgi:hypothetical protein
MKRRLAFLLSAIVTAVLLLLIGLFFPRLEHTRCIESWPPCADHLEAIAVALAVYRDRFGTLPPCLNELKRVGVKDEELICPFREPTEYVYTPLDRQTLVLCPNHNIPRDGPFRISTDFKVHTYRTP